MKNVLITGCSGFLSSYLINELEKDNNRILGLTEDKSFTSDRFEVIYADIRDKDKIADTIKNFSPEIIYHLAAVSNVGFSWKNPQLTYEINFIGSSNLFEAANKYSPYVKIILMSSAEVYSKIKFGKLSEESATSPNSPYALSKLAMEMAGDLYKSDMSIVKVRSFNFTGPGQNISFVSPDFASQIVKIEKGLTEPIIKVGNLSAKRDFSDVRDIARYLTVIGREGISGEIYNTCSGDVYSISEILKIMLGFSYAEIKVVVEEGRLRPVDKPLLAGDNSKIKNEFGLEPKYDLKNTLLDIMDFYRTKLLSNK